MTADRQESQDKTGRNPASKSQHLAGVALMRANRATSHPRALRFHYGWVVLAMGTLVVFGSLGLGRFSYSVVLPAMQTGLGMDNRLGGAVATANLAGYLLFCVLGGMLASRFGPRRVITAGLGLTAVSMIMTGLAQSVVAAGAWRALAGIGSGASNVPVMGLMAAWFAPRRRGLATGIAVAGSSIGLILLGPLVPRILTAVGDEGWRVCWFVFGAVTLALAVGAAVVLRDRPSEVGLRPIGTAPDEPPPAARSGALPWGEVYTRPIIWLVGFVYVAFGFSYIIYMTFFNKCLIADGGYTQAEAGRLFMVMGWLSLFCGLIWGSASDVIGRKGALAIVYLIQAAAFGLFPLWPTPAGFLLSVILFGLTAWSIPGIIAATCGDLLGPRLAPAALGFVTLFFGLGQAAGPVVAGAMADTFKSFGPAFWLSAGVALLGAAGSLLLPLKSIVPTAKTAAFPVAEGAGQCPPT
jgi:sugar phosphate permease